MHVQEMILYCVYSKLFVSFPSVAPALLVGFTEFFHVLSRSLWFEPLRFPCKNMTWNFILFHLVATNLKCTHVELTAIVLYLQANLQEACSS